MNIHNLTNIEITNENYWIKNKNYYSMQSYEKFINYFLSFIDCNKLSSNIAKKKIVIYGLQDVTKKDSNTDDNINILVSVENCNQWRHYKHYNLFGNYGDKKINIYIYNHISNLVKTERYIAIPTIYLQIDYFLNYYNKIQPAIYTDWNNKKDCLIVSSNRIHKNLNDKIKAITNKFNCEHIKNIKELKNHSCYHSIELLNVFNRYKFILCFENSLTDGYITEKIFNCYFSRSIPIYLGPNDVLRYFNKESFINLSDKIENILQKMNFLNTQENYNKFIDSNIINKTYNNENYKYYCNKFIETLI